MTKKKITALIVLIIALIGLVAGISFFRSVTQPAEGVITSKSKPSGTAPKTHLLTAKGKTATFQYPSSLQKTAPDKLTSQDVEKFSFLNPQLQPWDLAIQIRKLSSGALADDGSYNLRSHHPEQYKEQKLTINNTIVPIMADQSGGFGEVAFLTHGGLVAEVALTSGSVTQSSQLHQTLITVIRSWRWL